MTDTLRDLVLHTATYGSRPAVRVGEDERSFSDLVDRSVRLANALRAAGVRPGDRVAVMVEDGIRALEPHCASAIGGMVTVPVNARFKSAELDHVLTDCGATALLHTSGVQEAVDQSEAARRIDVVWCTGGAPFDQPSDTYELTLVSASDTVPAVDVGPDDLAMIGYTSGTTGSPKGAMMPHRSGLAAVRGNLVAFRVVPYGSCAFSGSVSFTALLWGFVYPHLYVGATIDLLQPHLDVDRWFDTMQRRRSTFTFVPTPLMEAFAERAARQPETVAALRGACHSASPATIEQRRAMVDVLGARYVESYGMTETLAAVAATTVIDVDDATADEVHRTIGRPLAPSRISILDEDGRPVPPGEVGEIVISSPALFSGYWNRAEATAAALRPDGFHTGDLGHADAEGYVYVDGRLTDLIISGGMNIYPAEVEQLLSTHPDVADVAVIGLPHPRWGESVCAVVVRRPGSDLSANDVIELATRSLAGFKKPARVEFIEELPRNTNLKVQKLVLCEQLLVTHD